MMISINIKTVSVTYVWIGKMKRGGGGKGWGREEETGGFATNIF